MAHRKSSAAYSMGVTSNASPNNTSLNYHYSYGSNHSSQTPFTTRLANSHFCKFILDKKPCPKGHRCTYAHSAAEWRRLPDDLRKQRLCEYYDKSLYEKGKGCPFSAEKCNFAHGIEDQRTRYSSATHHDHYVGNDSVGGSDATYRDNNYNYQYKSPHQSGRHNSYCSDHNNYSGYYDNNTSSNNVTKGSINSDPLKRKILHLGLVLSILRAIHETIMEKKRKNRNHNDEDGEILVQKGDSAQVKCVMSEVCKWIPLRINGELYRIDSQIAFTLLGTTRVKRILYGVPVVDIDSRGITDDNRGDAAGVDAEFQISVSSEEWYSYYDRVESMLNACNIDASEWITLDEYQRIIIEHMPLKMSQACVYPGPSRNTMSLPYLLHQGPQAHMKGSRFYYRGESVMCECCYHLLFLPIMLSCGHIYCYWCFRSRTESKDITISKRPCVICDPQRQPDITQIYKITQQNDGSMNTSIGRIAFILDSIIVKCPQSNCSWTGRYADIIKHLILHMGNGLNRMDGSNVNINLGESKITNEEKLACAKHATSLFRSAVLDARRGLKLYPPILQSDDIDNHVRNSTRDALILSIMRNLKSFDIESLLCRATIRYIIHYLCLRPTDSNYLTVSEFNSNILRGEDCPPLIHPDYHNRIANRSSNYFTEDGRS